MRKYSYKHTQHLLRKSHKGNLQKRKVRNPIIDTSLNKYPKLQYISSPKRLFAPKNFKLDQENCELTLKYINKVKYTAQNVNFIEIRLDNIETIDEGAISMLLSVIRDINSNLIRIQGTNPTNTKAKEILALSGFFKFMKQIGSKRNTDSRNTILTKGDFDTPPDEMAEEVRSAMKTVWGVEGRNPLLYGGIFEMIRNSCDHAFRRSSQVSWYLSITHFENENKVIFSFVDNGKGILKTLSIGPLKTFLNLFKDNADILDSAFANGIESRTGLPWRGKGLPTIYELIEDTVVENLVVIANNTYIKFDEGIKIKLENEYSGTYYYWEVSQNCAKFCFK